MSNPRTTAAVLCATGLLTAAAAVTFYGDIWPPTVSTTGIVVGVMAGLAQVAAAHGALRRVPMALHIGRWVSLVLGAVLLAIVISVAALGSFDLKVASRLLIIAALSTLQFLAANASRMQLVTPSNSMVPFGKER